MWRHGVGFHNDFFILVLPDTNEKAEAFPGSPDFVYLRKSKAMTLQRGIRKILHFFNLESELENPDFVYEEISKGVIFKGTNLWILIFATIIASVGLNMNSTAVIIGAMLISPLMGPINGMGYSIATYDFQLFNKSIRNFTFAIVGSLVASTLYFAISPVSTAHSELLARTSPTIYDVLIALFGGFSGIVAISSKQKGNVIPGVAIATALMPPLCTAGYGLATGQLMFFFGAIYLFTINTIFIAIATVWVSRLLNFPIRSVVEEKRRRHIRRWITVVITIVFLPSVYFGYELVQQERFLQHAKQYIAAIDLLGNNYLLKHQIEPKERRILLVYGGANLQEDQKQMIRSKSRDFNLSEAEILIEQGLSFSGTDEKSKEVFALKEQIAQLSQNIQQQKMLLDSIEYSRAFGKTLLREMQALYPQVIGCSYTMSTLYHDALTVPVDRPVVFISTRAALSAGDRDRLTGWLKKRLNSEEVTILFN